MLQLLYPPSQISVKLTYSYQVFVSHGICTLISWKASKGKLRFIIDFKNDDGKCTITQLSQVGFCNYLFCKLPENQKTNCDEKKVSCNSLDSHLLQLTIGIYDKILKCQGANMILKCRHKMSNSEKKVYYFLKKVYSFFHVFMIPYIAVMLIGLLQKNKKQ